MTPEGFRASAPDIDIAAMERDLSRIPAVGSARVVLDDDDQLREVHVVCDVGRSPKLVGRDVQSLLAARWGIDVDHRKVSVVQIEPDEGEGEQKELVDVPTAPAVDAPVPTPTPPPATAAPAPPAPAPPSPAPPPATPTAGAVVELRSMSLTISGDRAEVSVDVGIGERSASARAIGLGSQASQRRLAVTATFDALASLEARLADVSVGDVVIVRAGSDDVVLATLNVWRNGVETTVAGAAVVGTRGELRAAGDAITSAVAGVA